MWCFASTFSHFTSLSRRYGTKIEDLLKVHLRKPKLLRKDATEGHRLGVPVRLRQKDGPSWLSRYETIIDVP